MKIGILYATISGNSERLSQRIAKILTESRVENECVDLEGKDASILAKYDRIIIVTSTWGAGAVNDSLQTFFKSLGSVPIKGKSFLIIGLGDSNYGEYYFCKAVDMLEEKISLVGGVLASPSLKIDGAQESISDSTLKDFLDTLSNDSQIEV